MNIAFILSQPFGSSIGTDVRIKGLIKGLNKYNINIHIISPYKEKSHFEMKNIYLHEVGNKNNAIYNYIYYFTKKIINNKYFFKYILSNKKLLFFYGSSIEKEIESLLIKNDIDLVQIEQQIFAISAIKISKKLKIPSIVDFHGIWSEELIASGIINYNDFSYSNIHDLEKYISQQADFITVVSEEMKNYIINSFNINKKKVTVISNASFIKNFDYQKKCDEPQKIIHAGTLHSWENIELFINAIPLILMKKPNTEFYITKKGAKLGKVISLSNELKINPKFIWFNSENKFYKFLKECDIGVISSTSNIARIMAYPAKLYDYMSVGLPIIANDIGGWSNLIKKYKVGLVTENNPEAFAQGIITLLDNPILMKEYGINGQNLIKNQLNYNESAKKLYELYLQIVS